MTRHAVLTVLAASAALALSACKEGSPEPAANDHAADEHAGHDHAAPAPGAPSAYKVIPASKDYPLTTCVVSDEDLPALAKRVAIEFEGREVQFCCDHCIEDFVKDPKPYLAKLDAAKK